jgi:hypothetical protein
MNPSITEYLVRSRQAEIRRAADARRLTMAGPRRSTRAHPLKRLREVLDSATSRHRVARLATGRASRDLDTTLARVDNAEHLVLDHELRMKVVRAQGSASTRSLTDKVRQE